jgi:hypothetical protein
MKKTTTILISLAIFLMLVMPVFSFAQTNDTDTPDPDFLAGKSLVPCGHAINGVISNPCSFKDAMTLINGVIRFILFKMAVPIAAIMFFYAGFELVTSGGSTEKRGLAKKVFLNTVIGLVVAVGAWLIIRTILSILGYDGAWIFDKF